MTTSHLLSNPAFGPMVSVAITTFNSEEWLARALDSVLMQRTTFPIEILIGDDCSEDSTIAIAHSYREQHPGSIRVLERSKNVGIQHNYFETFEQCRGKYIAWLDADDYWTDPDKLTIQVETLESDSAINLCGHFVRHVTGDGGVILDSYPLKPAGRYGLEEIIGGCFISTPSVMFRNGIQRNLPEWYFDIPTTTDWPIFVLAALSGDVVLLNRVMADYVLTPGSASTSKGQVFWHTTAARFYEHVESILPSRLHRLVRSKKGRRYEGIAYLLRKQGDFVGSRQAAFNAFCAPYPTDNVASKTKSLVAAVVREAEWRLKKLQVHAEK